VNVCRLPIVWTVAMIHGDAGLMRGAKGRALASGRDDDAAGQAWFRSLGDRELDRAYRLAGFLLGDAGEAEDATQDALARAWDQRSRLRSGASVQAWFDRILVNLCRDRMRRRRIVRWTPISGTETSPVDDPFAAILARDAFLRAVAELDVDHRIVVVLRFAADLSIDAIAERLDVPAGTVKSRLHYALRELRRGAAERDPER
jgi:RNA polymerase sigma-70 factor (ECF subfamily)